MFLLYLCRALKFGPQPAHAALGFLCGAFDVELHHVGEDVIGTAVTMGECNRAPEHVVPFATAERGMKAWVAAVSTGTRGGMGMRGMIVGRGALHSGIGV